jgi:PDZ domain-containing protein
MSTDLPTLDSEKPHRRFRPSRRWKAAAAGSIVLTASLTAGAFVQLPYFAIGPGPARDVVGLVRVKGERTFPVRGALLLTTVSVSVHPISLYDGLASMFDPASELVKSSDLLQGHTQKEEDEYNVARMLESKYAAAVVALRSIGRPVRLLSGARIVYTFSNSPGARALRNGDVIQKINGKPVADIQAASTEIRAHKPGEKLRLTLLREDKVHAVTVGTIPAIDDEGKRYAAVGVWLAPAYRLPVDIQIDTQDIGGPSGGLVFALTIVDVLTEGDLTKGHTVGVTGTIDIGGRVGEIGGIEQKVRAAELAGADIFLAPASEAADATKAARTVRVLGVRTLDDALALLANLQPAT